MSLFADRKAGLASAWRTASAGAAAAAGARVELIEVTDPALTRGLPVGYVLLRADVPGSVLTDMPDLVPGAPPTLHRRWVANALARSVGRCPWCSAPAGLVGQDPEPRRAAFYVLAVWVDVQHAAWCPAPLTQADARWLVPYAAGGGSS